MFFCLTAISPVGAGNYFHGSEMTLTGNYSGLFVQSKNCGARETAVASERL
jgi:hypothetical protein